MAQLQAPPAPQPPPGNGANNNYIVTFQPGTTAAGRAAAAAAAGAAVRINFSIRNAIAVRIPNANVMAALQQNPAVVNIIPDRPVHAHQSSNARPGGGGGGGGTSQVTPLGVARVGAATATSNGAGIGVAIVDTGVDFNHPDLAPASESYSAFGGSCQDDNNHGTHVAGIVAALDNTRDVVGVAPAAKIYCVKVLDASGSGSDADVMAGLEWVLTNATSVSPKIRVVNMSLGRTGTPDDNPELRDLVKNLHDAGIAVVVSAGNDSGAEVSQMIPAGYPSVFAVASTTAANGTNGCRFVSAVPADTASFFTTDGAFNTSTGIGVTISAPGEDQTNISRGCLGTSIGILSLKRGGGTTRMSGTSMASPHVAGVVARIMQGGTSGVETIRTTLRTTASRTGTAPLDSIFTGYSFDGEREGVVKAP